jgi:hypothetical protein
MSNALIRIFFEILPFAGVEEAMVLSCFGS